MARAPILAAGGIVLRQAQPPLIAVVRLRKGGEWVLPKGKLDDGETARDAAEREVREETGHDVLVHEFLGTLVYEAGDRAKVVHYWRMEAVGGPAHELMGDVRAVDWLSLEVALKRLSRGSERVFLENVGPIALAMAIAGSARRPRAKPAEPEKRRSRRPLAPPPDVLVPATPPQPDPMSAIAARDEAAEPINAAVEMVEAPATACVVAPSSAPETDAAVHEAAPWATLPQRRRHLVQKVRDWLRRVA